ncbi:MAG: preprotein translocase subunit SecE [Planctomycetota bacterium]|nr:MAG: preprotein translocase subunit SecE [Planctomycetota bacterium]
MNAFIQELFRVGLYKRTQGRIVRQATFAAIMVVTLFGLWKLVITMNGWGASPALTFGLPAVVGAVVAWCAYRLMNVPAVADFLIAVEAEMRKVSWPTRRELIQSCAVVLVVIFSMAFVLYLYDIVWQSLFRAIGIV